MNITETTICKFKVELMLNGRIFTERFIANNLQDLSEKILNLYPTAKVVSVVGG